MSIFSHDEEPEDPWAGGLISNGRREQFEEMARIWDQISGGDYGFSMAVDISPPERLEIVSRAMERMGRQMNADLTREATEILLEGNREVEPR